MRDAGVVGEGEGTVKAPKRKLEEPDFITKSELAYHTGSSTETIDEWVAKGVYPPPRAKPGERHVMWLRRHYMAYKDTGEWPADAWPKAARQSLPSM